jgi:hypothetical protein
LPDAADGGAVVEGAVTGGVVAGGAVGGGAVKGAVTAGEVAGAATGAGMAVAAVSAGANDSLFVVTTMKAIRMSGTTIEPATISPERLFFDESAGLGDV